MVMTLQLAILVLVALLQFCQTTPLPEGKNHMHDANSNLRRHIQSQNRRHKENETLDIANFGNAKETLTALKHKREDTSHNTVRLITDEILKGEKKLENDRNNDARKEKALTKREESFGDNSKQKSIRRASTQWGDPLERSDLIPLERDSKRMKAEITNIKGENAKNARKQRFIEVIIGSSNTQSTGGGGGDYGSKGWSDSGGRNNWDSYHYGDYGYDYGYGRYGYGRYHYGDYYDWDESGYYGYFYDWDKSEDSDEWDDKK